MILHIPHWTRHIPADERRHFVLDDDALEAELKHMTDAHTDELFQPPSPRDIRLLFPVSRLVVDPERFADDADESMATRGMGAVYTKTSGGRPLRLAVSVDERQRLMDAYYWPHHRLLAEAVEKELGQQGSALIIDCHSFASAPLPHESDQSVPRPDICLGTNPFHTPASLLELLQRCFQATGLSVAINSPFAGTIVPLQYYDRNAHVFSLMIEVNRALYMDEQSGNKSPSFLHAQNIIKNSLATIEVG